METTTAAQVQVSSEFGDAEWDDFVGSASGATSAHLIEWRDLIRDVFGYEPVYRVARREGRICGVLPAFVVPSVFLGRHIVSVPFTNSGGICAAEDESRRALLDEARNLLRTHRARHFEMRCAYPPPAGILAREHKVRIVLDLPDSADQLWASLRGEIRNRIRRAENARLTVEFGSSDIEGFYRVFSENMRDLGIPAHPRRFFEEVKRSFGAAFCPEAFKTHSEGRGEDAASEFVVVRYGRLTIGGAILLRFRDTMEVPWISCSRRWFDKCPNNLLYWQLMKRACEEGLRVFDFGRSSPGTGPAVFKMRWGARAEQLYWHYVLPPGAPLPGETSSANPTFRLASALWKRMPRALTDSVGPRLIAHLPG